MATIIINGTEYPIPEGEKLNAIQMARRVGIDIPYYCWHPALSVVANCRMCEIETGTKDAKTGEIKMMPKLVPGCQTPAKDLTVLVTNSHKVKEHQRMIMEYLLLNHPLDCPVCDQAGECGLQDYSYHYGQASHRFVEERTGQPAQGCIGPDPAQPGPLHHVHAVRPVHPRDHPDRRTRGDATGATMPRSTSFPAITLDDNPLAGNVVDICPVGRCSTKTSSTSNASGSCASMTRSAPAARPAATSAPRRTRGSSGGSSRGPIRTSTITGSATRAGTDTRRRMIPGCWPRCTSARTTT